MVSVQYLAGFVDGEGSLSLNRIPRRGRSTESCARLSITNSNAEILKEFQSSYGGTLAVNRFGNPRWKLGYALIWTNAAAIRTIKTISPYLRVKARQASALIEFADHIGRCRRKRDEKGRLLSLSEREKGFRRAFFRRLRLLNSRGKPKVARPRLAANQAQNEEEWKRVSIQYLAGLMDGEGSIMITRTSVRNSTSLHYRARVTITNTKRQLLEDVCKTFGGIIARQPHSNQTWKTGYMLVWTSPMIRRLLPQLRPHLRLKPRQADLVLSFVDHVANTPQSRKGGFFAPHPKHVMKFREALYQRMKRLNKKGRAVRAS